MSESMCIQCEKRKITKPELGLCSKCAAEPAKSATCLCPCCNGPYSEEFGCDCQGEPTPPHTADEDCTLDDNGTCVACGVWHGDPCPRCAGRGFHREGCGRHLPNSVCLACGQLVPVEGQL